MWRRRAPGARYSRRHAPVSAEPDPGPERWPGELHPRALCEVPAPDPRAGQVRDHRRARVRDHVRRDQPAARAGSGRPADLQRAGHRGRDGVLLRRQPVVDVPAPGADRDEPRDGPVLRAERGRPRHPAGLHRLYLLRAGPDRPFQPTTSRCWSASRSAPCSGSGRIASGCGRHLRPPRRRRPASWSRARPGRARSLRVAGPLRVARPRSGFPRPGPPSRPGWKSAG